MVFGIWTSTNFLLLLDMEDFFNLFLLLLKKSAFYRNCLQHWVLCSNAAVVKCEAVSVKGDCADEKAKLSYRRKKNLTKFLKFGSFYTKLKSAVVIWKRHLFSKKNFNAVVYE